MRKWEIQHTAAKMGSDKDGKYEIEQEEYRIVNADDKSFVAIVWGRKEDPDYAKNNAIDIETEHNRTR